MTLALLYLLLLKATLTTFNGPSSLPVLRDDLVVTRKLLTDRELNAAVAAARCSPGPMGIYVVSAGYFAAGWAGACAGFLAVLTPALLAVPAVRFAGARIGHPRIRATLDAAVMAGAGLVVTSIVPLARDAVRDGPSAALAVSAFVLLVRTRIDTIWVILASATLSLAAAMLRA